MQHLQFPESPNNTQFGGPRTFCKWWQRRSFARWKAPLVVKLMLTASCRGFCDSVNPYGYPYEPLHKFGFPEKETPFATPQDVELKLLAL
jgi:hypothetical protein